jgi:UDP-N-acetylmuramate--alanine ligase
MEHIKHIYLLGIGGIGMSALARYFHTFGVQVSGYDKSPTLLTDQLQTEGINIHFEDDISKIPQETELVIYTPAIPKDLEEFVHLKNSGIPMQKRSQVLGLITRNKKAIAVSGTHGKTTVSSMIAHLLHHSKIGCSAFLGGIVKNYDSNLIVSDTSEYVVVEADEFDKSFMQLFPFATVITSIDADHLDIYGGFKELKYSFSEFAGQNAEEGFLMIKKGVDINLAKVKAQKTFSYSIKEKADYFAGHISYTHGIYSFDIFTPEGKINDIQINMHGLINVENALVAIAVALNLGVSIEEIITGISSFEGVKRRFDYQIRKNNLVFIDDYAHHPEEIKGLVTSVKKMYPGKKVLGIFQPHLFTRTRDFADDFAKSLDLLDEAILLPIYPAREFPIEGITSELLLNKMEIPGKEVCNKIDLLKILGKKEFEILLTIGAGDIDQWVKPIKEYLLNHIQNTES